MRLLDNYILKSVLRFFLGCLLVFLCLYIIIDVFSHLDEILKQKVALDLLILYYLSYLPIMFVRVTPVACLLATMYTLNQMNHHNEIIAMRSAGLSVFQITQTIIIIGTMMSLLVFWVNEKFLPQSLSLTERIKTQMESGSSKIQGRDNQTIENLSMYGLKNRLFFINKFFAATKTMDGIIILEHDRNQNVTKKIMANKGVYRNGLWRFYNSITFNFDQNGQIKQEPQYSNEEIMIIPETPDDFLRQRQRPDFMTMSELDEYIWKLSNSGATTVIRNLKIDLYKRFVSPFTSLIIVLLVIPFSLKTRGRAAGLSSIGLSVTVGFLYYVLDAVCIALGKGGILPPILSVSASHIIALVTALGLIKDLP